MTSVDPGLNLLLTAATPGLYAHNPFRITGLPVTAMTREVARYGDKLKLLLQVGGQAAAGLPALLGSEHVPGPDELREALRHLMDLRTRTLHEFFWLWPLDWKEPEGDTAFMILRQMDVDTAKAIWSAREAECGCCISIHNLAVLNHMRALDLSLQDVETPLAPEARNEMQAEWRMAMKRWWRIADEDALWEHYKARILQIDDPSVTTGQARRLHGDLHEAFARMNAMLAVSYAEEKRRVECQWHTGFLKFSNVGHENTVHSAVDHALTGVRGRLEHALQNAKRQTQTEEMEGIAKARLLLDTAAPLLKVVELVQGRQGGRDSENVCRGALEAAVAGYNMIYCSKEPSPAVLARRSERAHAEEYLRVLVHTRTLTGDADVQRVIDSNLRITEEFLQRMPPAADFGRPAPRRAGSRERAVSEARGRPRWSRFLLHCLRLVPPGVWVVFIIIAVSTCFAWTVNMISARPVASGKFTAQELAAHGLSSGEKAPDKSAEPHLPATGVLSRSKALSDYGVRLMIYAPETEDGTHFLATLTRPGMNGGPLIIFIRNGEMASVWLPAHVYDLTLAWGKNWDNQAQEFRTRHERKTSLSGLTTQANYFRITEQVDGTFDLSAPNQTSSSKP